LKLRLRVDNRPLLDVLARTARPPMSEHCASCLQCGGEREDVRHFLLRCSALQRERAQLSDEVAENMSALAESSPWAPARSSARRVAAVFAGADEESQSRLMLGCREDAVGRGRRAGSGSSVLRVAPTTRTRTRQLNVGQREATGCIERFCDSSTVLCSDASPESG